jgi:multidrug efflux pump subunit AcrB
MFDYMLKYSLEHRKTIAISVILMIVLTVNVGFKLGLQFFPFADTDLIYIDINNDESGNIDSTEKIVDNAEKILSNNKYILEYTTAIGNGLPKFYDAMAFSSPSENYAQIVARVDLSKLNSKNKKNNFSNQVIKLQNEFDENIVNGSAIVNRIEQAEPIGHPVRIRVTGDNLEELRIVANKLKEMLKEIDGAINIDDDFSEKSYKFIIDIEDDKANLLGITKYDIQNEVSLAIRGRSTTVLRKDSNEYKIRVSSNIETKEELENLRIKSSLTGNKILLKNIGEIELISEYPLITKYNSKRSIMVYCDVENSYSSVEIEKQINSRFDEIDRGNDVDLIFDGEREKILENFGDVTISAIFAIVLVFLILLIQFKSFIRAFIILFTIPLSIIGSILGLYIFNQNLSFLAMLGVVSLLGIVVNNAIVLVDYIDSERDKGKDIYNACLSAVDKRFRPIILTTATTIIGLTPLVYTRSVMFMPLAVALMSGLLVSTILTLVIIPTVYYQSLKHECITLKNS